MSALKATTSLEASAPSPFLQSLCSPSNVIKISLLVIGLLLIIGSIAAYTQQINPIAVQSMGGIGGTLILAAVLSMIIPCLLQRCSHAGPSEDLGRSDRGFVVVDPNDFVETAAPWIGDLEPVLLPQGWVKHTATQPMLVPYGGRAGVTIPTGDTYFTYQGKVAIGFHGTYNPPWDMS